MYHNMVLLYSSVPVNHDQPACNTMLKLQQLNGFYTSILLEKEVFLIIMCGYLTV